MPEFIAILLIKVVGVFLNFKGFFDNPRIVTRLRCEDVGFVKANEVFRIIGVF